MASALAKVMVSEDALIWAKVKKVLNTKGANAAIKALRRIKIEQAIDKLYAVNQPFNQ